MAMDIAYSYVESRGSDVAADAVKYSYSLLCVILEVPVDLPDLVVERRDDVDRVFKNPPKFVNILNPFRSRGTCIEGHWGADECYVAARDREFARDFVTPALFDKLVLPYGGPSGVDIIGFCFRFVGNKVILWAALRKNNRKIIKECLAKAADLYQSVPLQARGEMRESGSARGIPPLAELVSTITGHRQT